MMIVVGIMLLLVAAAATIMPAAAETRRIREAARGLNVYLGTARNRAMETGRPCGVTFHLLGSTPCAMNLDQREVPPPYEGQTQQSVATVTVSSGPGPAPVGPTFNPASGTVTVSLANEKLPAKMFRTGDLVQFNHQGEIYSITGYLSGGTDSNGFFKTVSSFTAVAYDPNPAPILPSYSGPVPFCILRSPVKSAATPLQLPAGAVVDFRDSRAGSNEGSPYMTPPWSSSTTYNQGDTVTYSSKQANNVAYAGMLYVSKLDGNTSAPPTPPGSSAYWEPVTTLTVLFSPTGAVDRVYYNAYRTTVTDPIYLLIGKRERVSNVFISGNANESSQTNLQDLKDLWVTINPQTGLVNTAPVAVSSGGEASAVTSARQFAAQGLGIGGR